MSEIYYRDKLYPFQDKVLKMVEGLNLDFYLTGGTALGRCYFDHQHSTVFHRIDSWRNILSNKLCSLSRLEIKDIADVVFISRAYSFDWESVITEAKEKDLWVDPIEICRIIDGLPSDSLKSVKWIGKVNLNILRKQIIAIRDDIFNGTGNSLIE